MGTDIYSMATSIMMVYHTKYANNPLDTDKHRIILTLSGRISNTFSYLVPNCIVYSFSFSIS